MGGGIHPAATPPTGFESHPPSLNANARTTRAFGVVSRAGLLPWAHESTVSAMRGQGGRRGTRGVRCTLLLGALMFAVGVPAAQAAVTINDVTVSETNDVSTATFDVTRTGGFGAPALTISYATMDGSARAPGDYTPASGVLSFGFLLLGGTQTRQVSVSVQGDRLDEAPEQFRVVISGDEVTKSQGVATIADDDPQPRVGVSDAAPAAEGGTATFTVALSAVSGRAVSVVYATADGSATAGQDYTARSGTVTIAAGSTSASVGVALVDDAADEPDETFQLRLSAPAAATLGDAVGTATIVDNDEPAGAGAPSAAGPPAAPIPPPLPPATGSGAAEGTPLRLGVSSPRLRQPATVLVTVSCPRQSGRCRGRMTLFSRPNRRSKITQLRRERRLGRRNFNLPGAGSQTLRIALSRRDRALLKRAGRISVRVYVLTTDSAGRTGVRRVNGTLVARTAHSG